MTQEEQRPLLSERPWAFLDTETTGLIPHIHEPIEIGLRVYPPDAPLEADPIGRLVTKIKPVCIETAEPEALEINGYNEAEWADAPTFADISDDLVKLLENAVIIGQNVSFDVAILQNALIRMGRSHRDIPYHKVDVATLAFEHLRHHGLPGMSLNKVLAHLGMARSSEVHGADEDIILTRRAFYRLLGATEGSFGPYPT